MSAAQKSLALHLGLIGGLFALAFILPTYHHGNFARIMVLATYATQIIGKACPQSIFWQISRQKCLIKQNFV